MDELSAEGREPFASGAGDKPVIREAEDAPAVPEAEVRQVQGLLQSLMKTKRAFEMYPSNNPLPVKFQEELKKRFDEFFESEDRLTLFIRQYDIFYKGQSVYHNPDKEDNLALFFYKDGLSELTFSPGFPGDELLDFIDVIRARPEASVESYDDDVVTLLWEKDFAHLSYYVAEEYVEGVQAEEDEVANILSRGQVSEVNLAEAYRDAVTEGPAPEAKEIFSPLESISMGFTNVFSLGEEEVKSLRVEIEGLTDEEFLEGAIYSLFESLYLDKGTPDFEILMNNLDSALAYLIHSGGFGTATLILKRFRELSVRKDEFNSKEIERIKLSITRAGSESRARTLAELLNSGREVNVEELKLFLFQLDKNAIIGLANLVGEIQDVNYRKALIDALVSLGKGNIEVLAAGLKSGQWFVVRNVAAILGRIGDRASLEYLKQAIGHPEPKVRREVVRALGMMGGPKAGEALLQALEDQDPQIRMIALRHLPGAPSNAVLDSLVEIITRPDFTERALPEKRAFFEVLAEIGQDSVMPFLVKLLKKRPFLGSARHEEVRASAAYGLGYIHNKAALEALRHEEPKAKKGSVLYEALSYSIHKLEPGPPGAEQEV